MGQRPPFSYGVSVPAFSKQFIPSTIGPGSTSTLRFDITNNNPVTPVANLAFVDNLPMGVVIATPSGASSTCGGTLDAPDGGGTITFSDGSVGAGADCSIFVNVTSQIVGTHSNVSGDLTSDAGNSGPAMADLTVDENRPGFTKAFSPDIIPLGSRSTLTFTIDNNNEGIDAFRVAFSDQLPAGIIIADPANASTDCDASVLTAMPGSGLITLSPDFTSNDPTLGSPDTCTVSVDVVGNSLGVFDNLTGDLTSRTSINPPDRSSGMATAALEVTSGTINLIKEFTDDPVLAGGLATLQFTIQNRDRDRTATDIAFMDDLDATLSGLVATGLPQINVCGGGSQISGTGLLSLTGGVLGPGESCMFSVTLQVPAGATAGAYPNITTAITADLDGSPFVGNQASDTLFVSDGPTLTKEFSVSTAGTGQMVTVNFMIANNSSTSSATDIAFSDPFGPVFGGVVITPGVQFNVCGAGSIVQIINNGSNPTLALFNGTLAASATCSFSVGFTILQGLLGGTYVNTTDNITATVDGITQIGNQASDSIDIVSPPNFMKSFTDDPVLPGATVTLEFNLSYSDQASADATDLSFSDNLSAVVAGLEAVGLPMNDVCGMGSQISGLGTLSFTGGTLAPGASCTFSVTLQVPAAAAPGSHTNTTSDLTATISGVSATRGPASDDLQIAALTFSKEFTDDPVIPGQTVNLEFTITNVTAASDATNIFFQDSLTATLSGLQAVAPLPTNPCGAGSTLSGTSTLQLTGGNLTAGTFCTFSATLQVPGGAADGDYLNSTSNLIATIDGTPNLIFPAATDVLSVSSEVLQLTKTFTDDPVMPGSTATLEFTITNLDPDDPAQDITFTDNLDAALTGLAAVGLPAMNVCGSGSQIAGTSLLTLTGGNIPAGGFCTFNVTLQVPADAAVSTVTNTTSTVSGTIADLPVSGPAASDTLTINLLTFTKSFLSASVAGGPVALRFTIANLSTTDAASGIGFTDDLNAVIAGLTAVGLPANGVCGAGSILAGTTFLTLTGGVLPASGSCSFDVTLQVPMGASAGLFNNTTSALSLSGIVAADPATASLSVEPPPLFSKSFNPNPIALNGTSTLTFTINNTASALSATGLNFSDNLPAGVVVANPSNASTTCTGGTMTAMAGAGVISYSGGTVAAGASCTVQADVTGSTAGAHVNTTGDLTSSSGNSGTAGDTLTVNPPPDFSKSFSPSTILAGGVSTLAFTIDNSTSTAAATSLDFTDNLPAEVIVATPSNASTTCTGGTLTATSGTGVISYSGGTVAAGASCTVQADVTSSTAGSHLNTSGDLTSSLGNSGTAEDTLVVNMAPAFSKSFSPNPILVGGVSTLTFTIDSSVNPDPATALDFTDNLPTEIVVATPANASTTCSGGTLTAMDGSGTISYSGGTVAAGSTCTVSVDVTSSTAGSHLNTSGALTSSLGNSGAAEDTLTVNPPPAFSKSFSPDTILTGNLSTLTFTIDNNASTVAATGLDFTDNLPANVVAATPPNASTTCTGGTLTAVAGSGTISYSGGTVAASSSCTVSVDVTSSTNGIYVNTSGDLTSSLGNSGTAEDTLTVNEPSALSKSFSPNPIAINGTTTLTFTIDNTNSSDPMTAVSFTDDLPSGVEVANPANASTTCTGGTLTAAAGSSQVSYSGGTVNASSTCTVSVDVSSDTAGAHVNTTSELSFAGGTSPAASDTLTVIDTAILLTKSFGGMVAPLSIQTRAATSPGVLPGGLVELQYTLTNTTAALPLTNIAFSDDYGAVIPGLAAVDLPKANVCGAGSMATGTSVLSFAGGSLAAGASCSFTVTLKVPAAAAPGSYPSTTSDVTADAPGGPITGPPAGATLLVVFFDFSKAFSGTMEPGEIVTLTFMISNPDPFNAAAAITFSDDLNAVLPGLAAVGLPQNDVCGAGSQIDGTSLITLTGGLLGPGENCSFGVQVKIPNQLAAGGSFTNVTSPLQATVDDSTVEGDPATAATAVLEIELLAIPLMNAWGLLMLAGLLALAAWWKLVRV